MLMSDVFLILMIISTILTLIMTIFLMRMKNKRQIHYAFIIVVLIMCIWDFTVVLQRLFINTIYYTSLLEQIFYIACTFIGVAFLYLGLIFAKTHINFTWKHLLILIVPIISTGIIFTNDFHHLVYIKHSFMPAECEFGPYFMFNAIYVYTCIGIGAWYLAWFSIKNSGFFSKQSIMILIGALLPLSFDILSTFQLINWPADIENVAFSISVIIFVFAIIKFDFLNVVPVALQVVVDLISDSYVLIDEKYSIIDFNKTFINTFKDINFRRKDNFIKLIKNNGIEVDENKLSEYVTGAIEQKKSISFEKPIIYGKFSKYFLVEITPIFTNNKYIATIILLKDITENKKNIDEVVQLNAKLKELANRDGLTRVYNRYFFDERLRQEVDRVIKQINYGQAIYKDSEDFGLIIFDIDFFKSYNDNNGHLAGDELLKELAKVVQGSLFSTDILCRYGGEEFAIICCKTPYDGVAKVAEKVREAVEKHEFEFQEKQPNGNLTISVGVSRCPCDGLTNDELIRKADENLYIAKQNGRNRVACE